ncbi:MAG: hypothetical protein ACOYOA_10175 [Saprospiraceae bacterium]
MTNSGYSFRSGGIPGLIMTILGLVALYYIAKGAFWLLTWLSPVLLIATLVLDYQVVINFLKMMWALILRNPVLGILSSILSIFGFPIVIFFLFGRAWFGYYTRKKQKEQFEYFRQNDGQADTQDDFVSYEEITDEPEEISSGPLDLNSSKIQQQNNEDYKK